MTAITLTSALPPAGSEPNRNGDILPAAAGAAGARTVPLIVFTDASADNPPRRRQIPRCTTRAAPPSARHSDRVSRVGCPR